jgi:RNA-directed DNA polymerase
MEENVLHPTEEGTPQGGIISPVLANMTLDGLERSLRECYPKTTIKGIAAKVNFVRYADDFIVTAASKELLEQEIKPLIEAFMRKRGLELSSEKTCVTHIEDGFDFLGQNVRKYKTGKQHKLLIKPAQKNVHAHLEKIRELIKKNQTLSAGRLILMLNPIIRGWAQYHQHVVSADIFREVDDAIYRRLRQWMKRRHPKKSNRWIVKKYFTTVEGNKWVFFGEVNGQVYYLADTASVPIKRHAKIKAQANPYDPAWEPYYEKRLDAHMVDTFKGKHWLSRLWKEQNGCCPICQQKITKITGWHSHHIEWRSKGGPDTAENRVLLHPTCHQQVHSQGLHVEKPRPAKGVQKA